MLLPGATMKRNAALRNGIIGLIATCIAMATPVKADVHQLAATNVAMLTRVPAHFTRDVLPLLTKVGCNQGA